MSNLISILTLVFCHEHLGKQLTTTIGKQLDFNSDGDECFKAIKLYILL